MPTPPRPCLHCGNPNLVFVPNVLVDIAKSAGTMLGMQAISDIKTPWQVTLVICNQCGYTQPFTTNTAQLAQIFGGNVQTVPMR